MSEQTDTGISVGIGVHDGKDMVVVAMSGATMFISRDVAKALAASLMMFADIAEDKAKVDA